MSDKEDIPDQDAPDRENLPPSEETEETPTPQGPTLPGNYPTEGVQKGDERKTDEELNPTPQGPTRTTGPEGEAAPDGNVKEG